MENNNEIKILSKDVENYKKSMVLEIVLNGKHAEIVINEEHNTNTDCISVDWDYLENHNFTDEENDLIDDWVMSFKYETAQEVVE